MCRFPPGTGGLAAFFMAFPMIAKAFVRRDKILHDHEAPAQEQYPGGSRDRQDRPDRPGPGLISVLAGLAAAYPDQAPVLLRVLGDVAGGAGPPLGYPDQARVDKRESLE